MSLAQHIDIGVASYGAHRSLETTLQSIRQQTASEFRCFVIDNPGPDPETRPLIARFAEQDARFVPVLLEENVGYAGAVNRLFELAESEYIAYCDNDVEIRTPQWDRLLLTVMQNNPEVGWMFPGPGHYGFENGRYRECLWNAGYCWILRRETQQDIVRKRPAPHWCGFDQDLGHHEEVDYMIRMRLAGWRIGCRPDVDVLHRENATKSPEAQQRIHDGVVRWMNAWNHYFCGDELEYSMQKYDPRALRYTDWNVCALYLERMTLALFPTWNRTVETINVPGIGQMDVVKVLKPHGCYAGRAI